jgi:hypothetical protein
MTAHQLDELHLTLAQMEVSDRARLAQAAGVNLSTVQKFAMSREHGVPSRTIEPLTPLAIEWSPSSGSTPRSRTTATRSWSRPTSSRIG